nr:MAG TPA: hypothetical protein [Bacteriophage sp.]
MRTYIYIIYFYISPSICICALKFNPSCKYIMPTEVKCNIFVIWWRC